MNSYILIALLRFNNRIVIHENYVHDNKNIIIEIFVIQYDNHVLCGLIEFSIVPFHAFVVIVWVTFRNISMQIFPFLHTFLMRNAANTAFWNWNHEMWHVQPGVDQVLPKLHSLQFAFLTFRTVLTFDHKVWPTLHLQPKIPFLTPP